MIVIPTSKRNAVVVASCRDTTDQADVFVGLDLASGKQLWSHQYSAPASLDYGNSPRATPTYASDVLVTLGATGILSALDPKSGVEIWHLDLAKRFKVALPTWGFSGSPLVVDEQVLVQVAENPSIVSLDLFSGDVQWRVSGQRAAYSSLIRLDDDRFAGVSASGYFVRRIEDGKLQWSAEPQYDGDFGVPAPIVTKDGVVFSSENNGLQHFSFQTNGLGPRPSSINDEFLPDSHSPVRIGSQLLVAHGGLHSLDLDGSLATRWSIAEDDITGYASIIASKDRAMITTEQGECLLVSLTKSGDARVIDRLQLSSQRVRVLSHPAVHQSNLLIRVGNEIRCYRLR